ncbi:MAG: hypothetical protein R3D90_09220 [Paracoccaceae bacterium]
MTAMPDLTSHDTFLNGAPHNTFARLRRDDPMHWTERIEGRSGLATRYADIHALNGKPDLLSSARGIRMEDQSYEEYLARRTFQETDPPEHMMTRVKVAKAFSKPVVAGLRRPSVTFARTSLIRRWRRARLTQRKTSPVNC